MTPIAIVGRACVLPGALSPEALWQAVLAGRDLTRSAAECGSALARDRGQGRSHRSTNLVAAGENALARDADHDLPAAPEHRWRLSPELALCSPDAPQPDRCWSDRGGYVEGFAAIWDPTGFALAPEQLAGLDSLVHWVLHCAREALGELGGKRSDKSEPTTAMAATRIGAVIGNLGFPSEAMAAYADQIWTGVGAVDPRNRFMSGGTAATVAEALGLTAGSYCLDAACASSLYAIKLACDQLVDGHADVMLAGAVQRADPLFLHQGFAALGALSRSGESRPFHRDADGLLPAEGCAILALKRLEDARRDGDTIHAVIRGIGLSNDGRGKGLLVPDEAGQQRAMRAAYVDAGIDPTQVSLLECHATGTVVGDGAELRSSAQVFAGAQDLPIGSLKSNLGHLITVAGAAGLIKLVEALRHGVRPPNRAVDAPTAALAQSPFRLLQQSEPWPDAAPRIAAISAFGFGGNNAHLIVSADVEACGPEWPTPTQQQQPQQRPDKSGPSKAPEPAALVGSDLSERFCSGSGAAARAREFEPVAVVGLGIAVGGCADRRRFTEALFGSIGDGSVARGAAQRLPGEPRDHLPEPSDTLAARHPALHGATDSIELDLAGLRFPPRDLEQTLPQQLALLQVAREALAETAPLPRERTAVLIGMEPDAEIARFGTRWRLAEAAGSPAWRRAAQGAVTAPLEAAGVLGCMPNIPANRLSSQFDLAGPAYTVQAGAESGLHALRIAVRALEHGEIDAALVGAVDLPCEPVTRAAGNADPTDAATALVLKRLSDAERDGDRVYALLASSGDDRSDVLPEVRPWLGDAGAADGLLRVAIGALGLHHRRHADGRPWLSADPRGWSLAITGMPPLTIEEARAHRRHGESPLPQLYVYAGADKAAVIDALQADHRSLDGPARLVLIASAEELNEVRARALSHLRHGTPAGSAVHYREQPIAGEIAFVFAGAGASYPGMGRELLEQLPQLLDQLALRSRRLATALERTFVGWAPLHRAQHGSPESLSTLGTVELCPTYTGPTALQQLWGASALSQLHLELSEGVLGLKADAWIGYSSGETNALVASGVWTDPDALMDAMEASGLVTELLGGDFAAVEPQWGRPVRWASWTVLAPVAEVRAALAGIERVHLAIITADADCLIAGDADGCARVVERIGAARCLELVYPLAVHVPELDAVAAAWLDLHRRQTQPPRHGRIYSTAVGCAYAPDSEACAQAILDQANQTLDLRPVVLQAWDDGVRTFIEHGPGGSFARAIRNILGEREALVVSLDRKGQGIDGLLTAVAALLAAGVPVDHQRLQDLLAPVAAPAPAQRPMRFAAHWPAIRLPPRVEIMAPAPRLPSALGLAGPHARSGVGPVGGHEGTMARGHEGSEPRSEHASTCPRALVPSCPGDNARVAATTTLIRAQLAQLSQQQRLHTQTLAHAQQQFLALRAQAQTLLLRAAASVGAASAAITAPCQPSAPIARERAPTTVPHLAVGAASAAIAAPGQPSAPIARERAPTAVPHLTVAAASAAIAAPGQPSAPIARERAPTAVPHLTVGAASAAITAPGQPSAPIARERAATADIRFTRAQLEIHADGRISEIFGPAFAGQDGYARQVRMPRPPLLLADRVLELDGAPGSMGKGRIVTETDVANHDWSLLCGRMPAGVMIEAGQADLMLISWLGVDALNRGERVYRLLGCELTYHGDLPRREDTLRFDIRLDGHAAQGDVRLMFFHYDCVNGERAQLSVRGGQAGFFTDAELAASVGCLWTPQGQQIVADPRLDAPVLATMPRALDCDQLTALANGDAAACFGPGFELARTHTRTPAIHAGRMLLLDRVTHIHAAGQPTPAGEPGSPWQRGYLRAELDIAPDQWFFDGHFKNDPCMPGTLMFEACLQALAIYLAAGGHTLKRDGWRFQPVPELPYQLQCRGQVTPSSRLLVTEVFVEELSAGPIPTVYADLLCTVDGRKAFHARRVALQLVPDWPLEEEIDGVGWAALHLPNMSNADAGHGCAFAPPTPADTALARDRGQGRSHQEQRIATPAPVIDGFAFDERSLLACALGRPSQAFGPMYTRFDGPMRVARLPSPPYHFISRIARIDGPIGVMRAGARVVAEYDLPEDVWYLDHNGARTMPFAVLLEAALQPCGWLSSYVGSALTCATELGFRNLDGEGTVLAELHGGAGVLVTEVELTDVSASAGMIIESFAVVCRLGDREVYRLRTVFGFFPPEALAAQAGLPVTAGQREDLERAGGARLDLRAKEKGARGRGQGPISEVFADSIEFDPTRAALEPALASRATSSGSTVDSRPNFRPTAAPPAPCPLPLFAAPRLPGPMLRMIDRIEGYWPDGGAAGLGQVRAVKEIDPGEWFFKAHFFQDPVQPGSLGLEAMLQTLQWYLMQWNAHADMPSARFETIALGQPHRWKYRGQVLPHHRRVHTTLEVTERGRDARGVYAIATASLWADGQRIYEAVGLGVRIVAGSVD